MSPWPYAFLSVVVSTVEEMFAVGPFVVSALFVWVNFELGQISQSIIWHVCNRNRKSCDKVKCYNGYQEQLKSNVKPFITRQKQKQKQTYLCVL
jgi:hypothetical protein